MNNVKQGLILCKVSITYVFCHLKSDKYHLIMSILLKHNHLKVIAEKSMAWLTPFMLQLECLGHRWADFYQIGMDTQLCSSWQLSFLSI